MGNMIGAGAYIALGEETTEGTAVSRDIFGPMRSCTLQRQITREVVEPLGDPATASTIPAHSAVYVTEDNSGGDLVTQFRYDDQLTLILLKHLFGAVATGGAGPYTYTFTLSSDQPVKPSLTAEVVRGTSGPANASEVFAGTRIGSHTLEVSTGQVVQCTWSLMAQTSAGMAAATSPTFETNRKLATHNHATTFTFNSAAFEQVTGVTLTIDRKLERTPVLGSLTSGAMNQGGTVDVTLSVRHRYSANTQHAAYLAGTEAAAALTLTNGTQSAAYTFANAVITSHSANPTSAGIIEATTEFRILGTAAVPGGVTLVVTNAVAP